MHWPERLRLTARSRMRLEVLAWTGLAAFGGYRVWPQAAAAIGVDTVSAEAPEFQVATLDGQSLSSSDLRGKVVLVNFWATWCPPCRFEMPGFQSVYDRRKADGFVVLGISTDAAGRVPVERFLRERAITYPVAMATSSVIRQFGGASMLPTSFLIDRNGRVRHEVRGLFASVALDRAVVRLLAENAEPR